MSPMTSTAHPLVITLVGMSGLISGCSGGGTIDTPNPGSSSTTGSVTGDGGTPGPSAATIDGTATVAGTTVTQGSSSGTGGASATTGGIATVSGTAAGGAATTSNSGSMGGTGTDAAASSTDGTASTTGASVPTSGCGSTTLPTACDSQDAGRCQIDVDGTEREYYVVLPDGYDANKSYPLVFSWHGLTGSAEESLPPTGFSGHPSANFYGVREYFPEAIYVSGQGLPSGDGETDYGWPNNNGRDVAFVRAMLDQFSSNFCVDSSRIFSIGFSFGGMFSFTLGCEMSDIFRAIAPMAGAQFGGARGCLTQPVAAWIAHGTADETVSYSSGESARDRILELNHCGSTTQPVDPSPCVAYDGCDEGYPVHWCGYDGGHRPPSFIGEGASAFFMQF